MKIKYILPALLALATTVTSSQAIATGLTYDPYENYYSEFYGIGDKQTQTITAEETQLEPAFYDPYADYYNTYYGIDATLVESDIKVSTVTSEVTKTSEFIVDMDSMADPSNYYNW